MRVGIISKHRLVNYGSFLQAYSLKHIIEELGHEAYFIDYRDEKGTFDYISEYSDHLYIIKKIFRRLTKEKSYCFYHEREHLFKSKLLPLLSISKSYTDNYDCDAVVVGSDEIFSICEDSPWGKSTSMLGGLVKENQILISYAASCGYTTVEKIDKAGIRETVTSLLSRYDAISVRDMNTWNVVDTLIGKKPKKNVDPVLLYDYPLPKRNKFKKYIVVYAYDYRISDANTIKMIKRFAKEKGLTLIALGMEQSWCDINYVPHPFELLKMIKEADYVVTDTFHGTVFSIKFQKQFATIVRESNKQKVSDLLSTFGLDSRTVNDPTQIGIILSTQYDSDRIRKQIVEERKNAQKYLCDNLKER